MTWCLGNVWEGEAPPHPTARKKSGKTTLGVGLIQAGGLRELGWEIKAGSAQKAQKSIY